VSVAAIEGAAVLLAVERAVDAVIARAPGAFLTLWGVFLALRSPHADWYVLPAVETVYYPAATRLESPRRSAQGLRKRIVPM
jgi:hypothetical protein